MAYDIKSEAHYAVSEAREQTVTTEAGERCVEHYLQHALLTGHTAGRGEAWEMMHHHCLARCQNPQPSPMGDDYVCMHEYDAAPCTYDTCPLLKDKDGEG